MFPIINHFNDVLDVIKSNDNFSVNRKDDYIVIDYILNTPDLFNHPIEKECRGIIFSGVTGELLSRPYHKFFNLNERPESRSENLDLSKPHRILEKLDGSMIRPFMSNGKMIWGSKAGETFLTPQVQKFVDGHPNYDKFARSCITYGVTPIFEWCSRKNRIVIDHPVDRLVLTGIRYNQTGDYVPYEALDNIRVSFNIDVVEDIFDGDQVLDIEKFYDQSRNIIGEEGYVLRFDDGHMVKIKFDEYLRHHRAKDDINNEKNVVSILVNNQADDFRGLLSEFDRNRFECFEKDFLAILDVNAKLFSVAHGRYNHIKVDRKDFAIESNSWIGDYNRILRTFLFDHWNEDFVRTAEAYEWIVNLIKKNCGSQTNVDKVRSLFTINWKDF